VFILAILYEGLKTLREFLIYLDLKNTKQYKAISTNYIELQNNAEEQLQCVGIKYKGIKTKNKAKQNFIKSWSLYFSFKKKKIQ